MTILDKLGDVVFLVFAYPFFMMFLFLYDEESTFNSREAAQTLERHEKLSKIAMKERKRNEPLTLSSKPRDLSIWPRPKTSTPKPFFPRSRVQPRPTTEVTSKLLRLPFEIREMIYSEVLGNDTLHLIQLPKRLGHLRCTAFQKSHAHDKNICSRECFHPSTPIQNYRYGEPMHMKGHSDNSLALLQICRQIYHEASLVLYQTNNFEINHPKTLLFLAQTIRPSRLASIRHLNLTWSGTLPFIQNDRSREPDDLKTWEETWRIIGGKMNDLRALNLRMLIYEDELEMNGLCSFLTFARKKCTADGVHFEKILEIMAKSVKGLRDFNLRIEIPGDLLWDVGELESRLRTMLCTPRI